MNLKEQHITDSLIKETLDVFELAALKKNLETEANYEIFLSKLLLIITNKDKTISLLDFLKFNNLSGKFLFIQNKKTDIIEELAELFYKGHESEITTFLAHTNDDIFNRHIQFLKETHNAIIFSERIELKKKLEKLDELSEFNLDENEIKAAVTSHERQILRKHFSELAKNTEVEVEPAVYYSKSQLSIGDRDEVLNGNEEPKFSKTKISKYKTVLRYAAILILVIGPTIFIVNQINKQNYSQPTNVVAEKDTEEQSISTSKQYAINDTKKQGDPIRIKIEPFEFQLPIAESIVMETKLLEEPKFGFAASLVTKVKLSVINISNQIDALEQQCKKASSEKSNTGNGLSAKKYCGSYDSLISIKETYTFNKKLNTLTIYTSNWKANNKFVSKLKLISIEKNTESILFLNVETNYYLIKIIGKNNGLIKEKDEDIIDQLNLIENQNE